MGKTEPFDGGSYSVLEVQQELKQLRSRAGGPSFAKIARAITENRRRRGAPESEALVSRSTVYDCFSVNRKRLDVDLVLDILRVLNVGESDVAVWERNLEAALGYASACAVVSVSEELPDASLEFTGRQEQRGVILDHFGERGGGLIWISGMPGVGKSSLAVQVARDLRDADAQGLSVVTDLRGFSSQGPPADAHAVLDALLRQLGVSVTGLGASEARASALRAALAVRPHVVILDDAAGADQVRTIIPDSTGLRIVVTSRTAANLPVEALHIALQPLSEDEALEMLATYAGAERLKEEFEAGRELVGITGNLPLALRLAGARITANQQWSLAEHVELAESRRRALRVEDSVAEAFARTYRALDQDAQVMLRLVAIHPVAMMSHSSAVALAEGVVPDPHFALQELLQHSMLTQPRPNRYALHELLRVHAADLSLDQDAPSWRRAARGRLDQHLLSRLWSAYHALTLQEGGVPRWPRAEIEIGLMTVEDAQAFLEESTDLLLLLALADTSGRSAPEPLVSISEAMNGWLYRSGRLQESVALHREALRSAEKAGDQLGQIRASVDLGRAFGFSGKFREAIDILLAVEPLVLEHGHEQTAFNNVLGTVLDRSGEPEQAKDRLLRTIELATAENDLKHQSFGWSNLGGVYSRLGETDQAQGALEEAAAISRRMGDREGVAVAAANLSFVLLAMERYEEAESAAREALSGFEELGFAPGTIVACSNIGTSLNHRQKWKEALPWFERAVADSRAAEMIQPQVSVLSGLAHAHLGLGNLTDAEQVARHAVDVAEEVDDPFERADCELALGDVLAAQHKAEEAGSHWQRAMDLFDEAESPRAELARERLSRSPV